MNKQLTTDKKEPDNLLIIRAIQIPVASRAMAPSDARASSKCCPVTCLVAHWTGNN